MHSALLECQEAERRLNQSISRHRRIARAIDDRSALCDRSLPLFVCGAAVESGNLRHRRNIVVALGSVGKRAHVILTNSFSYPGSQREAKIWNEGVLWESRPLFERTRTDRSRSLTPIMARCSSKLVVRMTDATPAIGGIRWDVSTSVDHDLTSLGLPHGADSRKAP
jgi:hypothetical protein